MKNVLILGGAGFVGANLVRHCLKDQEIAVTVLDSLDPHFQSSCKSLEGIWNQIRFVRGSVTDDKLIADLVQDKDVILNLAGQSSHTLSVQYPLLDAEINCMGHLKLLEAVRIFNPKSVVVYASSSTVVGRATEEILDENHPERPLEIYSANKGVAEKYYRIYHKLHGLKTVILRFSNLYGPFGKGDPAFGFINYFISLAWNNKPLTVYGEGDQTRNVMFAEDACDILLRSSRESKLFGEICFATSPFHLSVREIAESITRVFSRGIVEYVEWPEERRKMDVNQVQFSSEKLRAVTGWQARYDFVAGLEKTRQMMEGAGSSPLRVVKP